MSAQTKTKKPRAFRSLAVILAVAFLTLSVAILLIAGGLQIYLSFRAQQEVIAREQDFIAKNAANEVRDFIHDKLTCLGTIARVIDIGRPEEQKQALGSLLVQPAFRQSVLLNVQGEELMKVSRLSKFELGCFTEQIRSEFFSQVSQGKEYISSVCIDKATNEPMVIMVVPVTNVFGDFQGALAAELNLKFMWDLIAGLKIGEKGLAYVVDKEGNLLAFGDISRVLRRENLTYLKEVNEFVKGDILTHKSTADISRGIQGNLIVANHAHLENPDWAVMVELPIREAYKTVISGTGLSMVVVILSAILATIFGIYLSKRITKPITQLIATARMIAEGDLTKRAEVTSRDEIGQLAITFNEMTDKLEKSYRGLEEKVKERTKELDAANQQLRASEQQLKAANQQLTAAQKQLQEKVSEMERFHKLTMGREEKIIELKERIKELEEQLKDKK